MTIETIEERLFPLLAAIALAIYLCSLTGCATVEDTCDHHPDTCAITGAVIVAGAAIVIAHKATPRAVTVRQNQPSAPINAPQGCAILNTCAQ